MTGPEHFREAERLLRKAGDELSAEAAAALVARAHVHATLARTAAAAYPVAVDGQGRFADEWLPIVCDRRIG